jgi:hypothetical protein
MATITAAASGNWSAGATWVGGVKPGLGDTAKPAGFTVTIDEDVDIGVGELDCVAQNGYFQVTVGGLTIRCATIRGGAHANSGLRFTANAPNTLTVIANAVGGSVYNAQGIRVTGTGTLNITGNVTGGLTTWCSGIKVEAGGTVNLIGNVVGGNLNAYGLFISSSANVDISGDAIGGQENGAFGLYANASALANIVVVIHGDCVGGTGVAKGGDGAYFAAGIGTFSYTVMGDVRATKWGCGAVCVSSPYGNVGPTILVYGGVYAGEGDSSSALELPYPGIVLSNMGGAVKLQVLGPIVDSPYGTPAIAGLAYRNPTLPDSAIHAYKDPVTDEITYKTLTSRGTILRG